MQKPAIIRSLEHDRTSLDHAAAAMYRIREPKGSQRIPFWEIREGKQERNRELALQTVTAVFNKYPDPAGIEDPEVVLTFLGEHMYRTLAPHKSEVFPYDQRTPFARSCYRSQGEQFFRDFLLPLAERHRIAVGSSRLDTGSRSLPLNQPLGGHAVLPRGRTSDPPLPPDRKPSVAPIGPGPGSDYAEPVSASSGAYPPPAQPGNTSSSRLIPMLLTVIVILLLVLVVRSF